MIIHVSFSFIIVPYFIFYIYIHTFPFIIMSQETIILNSQSDSEAEEVAAISTESKLKRLKEILSSSSEWISDPILDYHSTYLNKYVESVLSAASTYVYFLRTDQVNKMTTQEVVEKLKQPNTPSIWKDVVSGNINTLFIPLHRDRSHWWACVMDFNQQQITYYDSQPSTRTNEIIEEHLHTKFHEIGQLLSQFRQAKTPLTAKEITSWTTPIFDWASEIPLMSIQQDSDTCGDHVMLLQRTLLEYYELEYSSITLESMKRKELERMTDQETRVNQDAILLRKDLLEAFELHPNDFLYEPRLATPSQPTLTSILLSTSFLTCTLEELSQSITPRHRMIYMWIKMKNRLRLYITSKSAQSQAIRIRQICTYAWGLHCWILGQLPTTSPWIYRLCKDIIRLEEEMIVFLQEKYAMQSEPFERINLILFLRLLHQYAESLPDWFSSHVSIRSIQKSIEHIESQLKTILLPSDWMYQVYRQAVYALLDPTLAEVGVVSTSSSSSSTKILKEASDWLQMRYLQKANTYETIPTSNESLPLEPIS